MIGERSKGVETRGILGIHESFDYCWHSGITRMTGVCSVFRKSRLGRTRLGVVRRVDKSKAALFTEGQERLSVQFFLVSGCFRFGVSFPFLFEEGVQI